MFFVLFTAFETAYIRFGTRLFLVLQAEPVWSRLVAILVDPLSPSLGFLQGISQLVDRRRGVDRFGMVVMAACPHGGLAVARLELGIVRLGNLDQQTELRRPDLECADSDARSTPRSG
ncbi:hypothetical protein [Kribbella steppae]|uniref:hypothetical protein n=1 Tax=Kribbella steppae TaxID=2512223 RepID=UPI00104AF5DA|nr:hypothetical protein [Kribbella steppae]